MLMDEEIIIIYCLYCFCDDMLKAMHHYEDEPSRKGASTGSRST
jgi:hypothetical protein